jgi:L,D-transpeptidase ErfK/SrfK
MAPASQTMPALAPPLPIGNGIVINIPQRLLFYVEGGRSVARYPVGLGLPSWPTFVGPFTVAAKETDPTWDVPPSIQAEMQRAGRPVRTKVPPGPGNPLGKHWLGLSVPGFGIHGTNAPASVGKFATHGCIRMRAADIADLFARVEVGSPGVSIYEPVLLETAADAVWLEAHRDVYERDTRDVYAWVMSEAARRAPALMVDPAIVRRELKIRDGRPHRIDVFSTAREFSRDPEFFAPARSTHAARPANFQAIFKVLECCGMVRRLK